MNILENWKLYTRFMKLKLKVIWKIFLRLCWWILNEWYIYAELMEIEGFLRPRNDRVELTNSARPN